MLAGITLYDFQIRTVKEVVKAGRGVVQLPTGAGKTEIAIAATKALSVPTLFLTHRVNLLYQTAKRYAQRNPEIKDKIGVIGDGNYSPNFITLATVQTIWSALKRYPSEIVPMLKQFQMLIIDEAHRSGAKQFYKPSMLCSNAYYRLGLTATPFMNGNKADDMYLMGTTGPVASKVSYSELIDRGILAKPFFKFFAINEPKLTGLRDWRDIYEQGIIYHNQRNAIVATQAAQLASKGKKILIIVNEVKHGQILTELCTRKGVKIKYQDGSHSYAQREKTLKWLASTGDAIIATNIFDEGIDCSQINAVILAAGTKSAPALFQRTGRATRRKETDNYAIIIDFIDNHHPKLAEHSKRRFNLVKREKGFNIL
jgi:superfamily II DNA or RNA helicase